MVFVPVKIPIISPILPDAISYTQKVPGMDPVSCRSSKPSTNRGMLAIQKIRSHDLLPAHIPVISKEYANAHNPLGSEKTIHSGRDWLKETDLCLAKLNQLSEINPGIHLKKRELDARSKT